jgi:internalin A
MGVGMTELHEVIKNAESTGKLRIDFRAPGQYVDLNDLHEMVQNLPGLRAILLINFSGTELPSWLASLTGLEELHIRGSGPEVAVFPVLIEMPFLRYLGLHVCGLRTIPEEIGALTNLDVLELSGNQITELPPSIANLGNLQVLDLGMNPLLALPESFGDLHELTHLYIWGHQFSEMPSALRGLRNLQVLDLSTGGTANIRDSDTIDLRPSEPRIIYTRTIGSPPERYRKRFNALPSWLDVALPDLRELYLGGHSISNLPGRLPGNGKLQRLFLSDNGLGKISEAILECQELKLLDLRGNHIADVPAELQRLEQLLYLDLTDNPLPIPPEVLEKPDEPRAIFVYTSGLRETTRSLNEAKLLIVGEGSVGKTSLVNRLVHSKYAGNQTKTEGIDVTRWRIAGGGDEIAVNIWDFGGQEIMHATHQFFLTKRSVYALVIDARQGEEQNRIEYWLKLIQGFSYGSPVIIIGNKSDQSVLDIDQRGLKAKYDNIVDIISLSCLTGNGVGDAIALLTQTITQLPHVGDLLPTAFFEIKQYLEELEANYLAFDEYERLCISKGVTTKSAQELLIGFLHDLGTVLCFRDDPRLADTNILNPSWVTGGVYRLLNSNVAAQRKGLLAWQDIDQILDCDDYPSSRRFFIIDMMKRFELCYEADQIFLIPDLLTKEEPDTGVWDDALHFEVRYDVLPSSIISRLIVRMSASISKGTVWRTGMVLALDRNRALVKGDREDAVIRIEVSGPKNGRRGLLTAVRTELRGIEKTIPGLNSEERVPVPGHPGIWVPYKHLLDLEMAGRETVVPQGLTEDFTIRELLAGIETPLEHSSSRQVTVKDTADPAVKDSVAPKDFAGAGDSLAQPWTVRESMKFGSFLVIAIVVILGACLGAYEALGATAAGVAASVTLIIVIVIGLFMLRSSGRITESGFLSAMKQILSNMKNAGN